MNYKIIEKDAFKVIGLSRVFNEETSYKDIPTFWTQHDQGENGKYICGRYGICMETSSNTKEFEYMIADDYDDEKKLPTEFKIYEISKHTWAVFQCVGPMPQALQEVETKIFSEWLPNWADYSIATGEIVEYYSDLSDYEKGSQDEKYYSEIWIPIIKK